MRMGLQEGLDWPWCDLWTGPARMSTESAPLGLVEAVPGALWTRPGADVAQDDLDRALDDLDEAVDDSDWVLGGLDEASGVPACLDCLGGGFKSLRAIVETQ